MKILHSADWHLGAYVGPQCDDPIKRMEHTRICLEELVKAARLNQPDIILIAGDIFHQSKVWSDRAMIEVRTALEYISVLASYAPVCVLYGTPNHDNMESFKMMQEALGESGPVTFFFEPELREINTKSGIIQIGALPGFDKGHFRALYPGLSAEEENQIFTQQLSSIIQGLSAQINPEYPSVLMAHHTVVGCELDNGQHVFQANEVVLEAAAIDNSAFDLVCLGHIHKAQKVEFCKKPVYYAGSIDAFTFNDEDHEKGFWLHSNPCDYDRWQSVFLSTPAREFHTAKWNQELTSMYANNQWEGQFDNCFLHESIFNKVVRVLYSCNSDTEKALDKKKLEHDLYAAGAYYVSEIRPEKIETSVNRDRLHEKLTVEDCLKKYLSEKGYDFDTSSILLSEAMPLIQAAESSTISGGQTGMFIPLEISVRNYRSYAEEKFSFEDIFFAMVNGRNGIGKSSLFMDAIVDCLYEQPREGDLTGWIRAGEKSGSISFTFQLGYDIYRVSRTRQKSGKATLALSFFNDEADAWADHSCQKLVDTQEKIQQLLGMDADTFKSCVLIMQDQYGKFMEAKPEDRMSVLASLLGLGIYEQLEEDTKKLLQDVNRELRQVKEEVSALELDVSQIEALQFELESAKAELKSIDATLSFSRQQRDDDKNKLATIELTKKERDNLLNETLRKESAANDKQLKLEELKRNAEETKLFISKKEEIGQQHEQLNDIRIKLSGMESKANLLQEKQIQRGRLELELNNLNSEKSKLESEMKVIQLKISGYSAMNDELKLYEGSEDELKSLNSKQEQFLELSSKISEINNQISIIKTKINSNKNQALMLEQSDCINITEATCRFLKSAKEASANISKLESEKDELECSVRKLIEEQLSLGYTAEKHFKVKEQANRLTYLKHQMASIDGDKKLLEVHRARFEEVVNKISEVTNEKGRIDTETHSLQQDLEEYDELKSLEKKLEPFEAQWQQIPIAEKYLDTILPQIDDLSAEISQLINSAEEYKKKAVELSVQISDSEKVEVSLRVLNASIAQYETDAIALNRKVGSLEEKLAGFIEKQAVLTEKMGIIEQLASKAVRLQVLADAFSQDGIPHQIVRDIIPELEASANEILGQMTGGKMRLEFRTEKTLKSNRAKEVATLDIVIIDVEYGELPYLSRSGGQKVRAALAVSFALAMVKASRVGLQLGMMFVDEPPFLDEEGVEAYCMALQAIHNKYPEMRIVAISHDENMKARFPQQLTVITTENGSKVVNG